MGISDLPEVHKTIPVVLISPGLNFRDSDVT
jgi:hypothetical protein